MSFGQKPYCLLLFLFVSRFILALPSNPSTNSVLFQPTNGSFPSLLRMNLTTNIEPLTGYKWQVIITEGLFKIEAEYPNAILAHVHSSTEESGIDGNDRPSLETTDPASFGFFRLFCHDKTEGPEDYLVSIHGTLQPETGQVYWGQIGSIPIHESNRWWYCRYLDWPPDHDLFEAAKLLKPALAYWRVRYERNEYHFEAASGTRVGEVAIIDERTLRLVYQKWWRRKRSK